MLKNTATKVTQVLVKCWDPNRTKHNNTYVRTNCYTETTELTSHSGNEEFGKHSVRLTHAKVK